MKKKIFGKRAISLMVALAMLLSLMPVYILPVVAGGTGTDRVTDPSTMDSWMTLFPTSGHISTENAGRVWMDKSVLADASAFGNLIKQKETDSFLVALSAMAANMSITGMSHLPTDTMLVLDVSGSMNGDSGNNDVAEELVQAANESLATLLETNPYNRVGVVLYSGSSSSNTNSNAAAVLLPLNRYTTAADGNYLTYSRTSDYWSGTTETVGIDRDVRIEGTGREPDSASKEVVGATYIQKGVVAALEQFSGENNDISVNDPVMGKLQRKPVLVLMSDGAPSLGSTSFTAPGQYDLGSGSGTSASLGFVTQLTMAYAKAKIEEKYQTEALFYTLGLGLDNNAVAIGVLDPSNKNASTALSDYWDLYNKLSVGDRLLVDQETTGNWWGNGTVTEYHVTKISTELKEDYVDVFFSAESETLPDGTQLTLKDKLKEAFEDIVSDIQLQSGYFPTLISGSEELSGYVSFVDRVGQYMDVTEIKGILMGDRLFSGADLAGNFVPGGGSLGTYDDPTALGAEMVAAVRARLGLDSDDTARALIAMAYEHGQLSYTDADTYSNYIGWYANAAGQFLGFYHEGVTQLPAATGNVATDPAFAVKSYGYLGAVDASHGVSESDMMYATVQVRQNIATGEQLVTFAIPAALIPVITYHVTLDENGTLSELSASGASSPIRLVYEVALREDINAFNVREKVSADYLAENSNADGSVNFYTNQWEHENTVGYGTVNTYSYFNPSRQNEKYYYLEDAPVYIDQEGTLYTGETQPAGMMYRGYKVYTNNGGLRIQIVYRPLSEAAKATAVRKDDGSWYIPKGNVHVNLDGYTITKSENLTNTLQEANIPFVDTKNHSVNDMGYQFYVGATLGNNGKLTVMPQTGIRLSKTMAADAATPAGAFTFTLTNLENAADDSVYPAWLMKADGTAETTQVQFEKGVASVTLHAGDTYYIGGMTHGEVFRIVEQETVQYVADTSGLSAEGTVTVNANRMQPVEFINSNRGTGRLTVAKKVAHDFGVDYRIPADRVFTMEVTLSGIGTVNAAFRAEHTNGDYSEIKTDENGKFTVQLKHDEQLEILDLPAGTEVTVKEIAYSAGFAPVYWDNGVQGDGSVTVIKDATASVIVVNAYQAAEVYPVNITVSGSKVLNGRSWQDGDNFRFALQKLVSGDPETWQQLGDVVTAVPGSTEFSFDNAFENERYEQIGTYYYRIVELEPQTALGGISYDKTVHSFAVVVTDADMDGKLEISQVKTDRPNSTTITGDAANGWNVDVRFVNTYSATGSATVTVDVNKLIENNGGAEKTLAGYRFGLFDPQSGEMVLQAPVTTERGFTRFVLNYTAEQAGNRYTYVLKEIAPDPVPAGWHYSTEQFLVTVEVMDNGDGTISAVIYTGQQRPANVGASAVATFTNRYDPEDAQLDITFVKKQLSGRAFGGNDSFSFVIKQVNVPAGTQSLPDIVGKTTADSDADGVVDVVFDKALAFDCVGNYYFSISETSPSGNGIVKDPTVYGVIVTVTDQGGRLVADYVLVNAVGDTITFRNVYTAEPVSHSIAGIKELEGKPLINGEFTFVLTEMTVDGEAVEEPVSWTATNLSALQQGRFSFPAISYTKPGTYTYLVTENAPDGGKAHGIVYDHSRYEVTVVIEDDLQGRLIVRSETVRQVDGEGTSLVFRNVYVPEGASTQFSGDKELTGRVLGDLKFEFELYLSDSEWNYSRDTWQETVSNDENGLFRFRAVKLDTVGDHYFVIKEVNGGQTIDGITYDDTVYRIRVEVTDDQKGQLHAKLHIYDEMGIPQGSILFVNRYQVSTDAAASVTLSGTKTLSGREWNAEDRFTFELTAEGMEAIRATVSQEDPSFSMTLHYSAEDVGKTFLYTLQEVNAGQTIDRVIYSTQQYHIRVEVRDDGVGGVATEVVVENATADTLDFLNVYVPQPADLPVEILVQKTVVNKGTAHIGPGGFAFMLDARQEGMDDITLRADEAGQAKFTLTSTEEDIGKVYSYRLTEIDENQAYVTYSKEQYEIRIAVTLSEENTLVASFEVNGEAVQQVVAEFENEYDYSPSLPATGDQTGLALWVMLLCISGGAVLMIIAFGKRRILA